MGRAIQETVEFTGLRDREAFVVPPAVLDPLIRAYEAKHEVLENEVVNLQGDSKRLAAAVELLLSENNKLRSHLVKRDNETSHLLETIGLNDGETVLKLKKQIEILEDEVRVLYLQLNEQKVSRQVTRGGQIRKHYCCR